MFQEIDHEPNNNSRSSCPNTYVHALAEAETSILSLESIQWGKPGGGEGFPVGVQTQLIETDDETLESATTHVFRQDRISICIGIRSMSSLPSCRGR